jgi:hypothetical protein
MTGCRSGIFHRSLTGTDTQEHLRPSHPQSITNGCFEFLGDFSEWQLSIFAANRLGHEG